MPLPTVTTDNSFQTVRIFANKSFKIDFSGSIDVKTDELYLLILTPVRVSLSPAYTIFTILATVAVLHTAPHVIVA